MDSTSAQVVSTIGRTVLNELRVQYARRHQFRTQGISVDGPAITVAGRGAVRRRAHRRRQLGRVRLPPGDHAGHRQRQPDSRHARLQGRRRRAVGRRQPRQGRALPLQLRDDRGLPGGEERRQPVGLLELPAAARATLTAKYNSGVLRLLRAGRLAGHAAAEAAVRRALRRLRRAVGAAVRAESVLAGLHHRQEQLRAARRACRGRSTSRRGRSCARRSA